MRQFLIQLILFNFFIGSVHASSPMSGGPGGFSSGPSGFSSSNFPAMRNLQNTSISPQNFSRPERNVNTLPKAVNIAALPPGSGMGQLSGAGISAPPPFATTPPTSIPPSMKAGSGAYSGARNVPPNFGPGSAPPPPCSSGSCPPPP